MGVVCFYLALLVICLHLFRNKRETPVKANQMKPLEPFSLKDRLADKWGRRLQCFQVFQEMSNTQEIGKVGIPCTDVCQRQSVVITAEICFYRPHWAGCKYVLKPIPSQQGAEMLAEVPAVPLIARCSSMILTTPSNRFAPLQCLIAISKVIMWRWHTWTRTWL